MDGCDRSRAGTIPVITAPFTARSTGVNPSARCASIGVPSADESLDQSQLPGDDAPVKSIVAERVARLRQVWLPPQDGADLSRIPGDDRFLQLIEIGRVVIPLAHRPLEHFLDLAMPALFGREKQLVP